MLRLVTHGTFFHFRVLVDNLSCINGFFLAFLVIFLLGLLSWLFRTLDGPYKIVLMPRILYPGLHIEGLVRFC